MDNLTVKGDKFYMGEKPIQLISGAMHYFRIIPEYWEDRLLKLKACGFNCVETYVPWNLHEPKEGVYNFEGIADIERFIQTAEKIGLYVIVRPSPYICAEWEFGGLPSWLLKDRNMRLRSAYQPYLEKIDHYYDVLLSKIKPLLSTQGGPVIALQIENEYGSYGNDKAYLNYIKHAMIDRGMDVLLFTSDGPTDLMLQGGSVDGVLATVNFGSRPKESFELLQKHFPNTPNMVMEYWNGWFDHWGEKHHTREAGDAAETFEEMVKNGDSVNFYMFHGGTNFGFYNGANHDGEKHQPTVTSYDYDCPLSESGDLTDKYYAIQKVMKKYYDIDESMLPEPIPKKDYGTVYLEETASLFSILEKISKPVYRANPETMEELDQDYGFILYRTQFTGPMDDVTLTIDQVRDRALVFVNGEYQGVIDRWDNQEIKVNIPAQETQIDILVENMGRINYGPEIYDPKGITRGVRLQYQYLFDWEIYTLPLDNIEEVPFTKDKTSKHPRFKRGVFHVAEIGDTFLEFTGWKKGVAFVNGFNIGRYWEVGPQETLYVPGSLLKEGENEIILFELHEHSSENIKFIDTPKLG